VFENPGQFGKDNADIITDFRRADGDKIVIARDLLSDTKKASLESVAGKNNVNKAGRTSKSLIYDNKNGALYFNENGKESGFGDGGQLAKLLGAPAIGIEDIIIV
jgi:Ca2+-binding RTX toxin-like protein